MGEIIIIGNARCYHSIDWYRTIKKVCNHREVLFATDLIDSESHLKLVSEEDQIIDLYNIDRLLFKRQTAMGNFWRNIIKFLASPFQILKIKSIKKKYPDAVFHAHTMYYMFCCWLARIRFIGTPQGSEVLVRPDRSSIYRYFARKALKAADHLIVDSENLKNKIRELCGEEAVVIQNGMDASTILTKGRGENERTQVTSFRGMHPLYRIEAILERRANSIRRPPITFIYPFWEEAYKGTVLSKSEPGDVVLGRLLKDEMYELFFKTLLAISIPKSDSSPRSVYEAIFCGCCVAVTYNSWIENLPSCMRSRLFIVDLEDEGWFDKAIAAAHLIAQDPFIPSEMALNLFDQERTMKRVVEMFYGVPSNGSIKSKEILQGGDKPHPSLMEVKKEGVQIMKGNRHHICSNCVMDTTDPKITFDDQGVCDHCRRFYSHVLPNWHTDERGWDTLQNIIDKIKREGKGKDFDCILGMSGGVDSSYLTYIAKEKLGLRPLVFHVDAGWNSQVAVNNIEKLVDKLGLDLYTEVIDWEEMRDLQLAFFKSGVSHIDLPQDHAFFATMYKFAEKHQIKYILTGANISTECVRNPLDWLYYGTDTRQIRDIHKRFGRRPLVHFPLSNILRHKLYLRYIKGIKVVTPLNHIPYHKEQAMHFLVENFGWQKYPQKHFESRFTKFYEGYWLPRKFGYDTRKVQFSSLILTNQMTREEALEKISRPPYDENTIAQDFEYVATKLGISVKELQGYMDAPNRSAGDYKSQEGLFLIGSKIMTALRLDERMAKR